VSEGTSGAGHRKETDHDSRDSQADQFKEQLRESLLRETLNSCAMKVEKHDHVYTCGDQDATVYFIERGQVKLLMLSPEGKECLLAIHTAGDIFGELCPVPV
jgi:CRP-like cAMP-binding protein